MYCADIITFNTIALKGAIRDVCRALYQPRTVSSEIKEIADIEMLLIDEQTTLRSFKQELRNNEMYYLLNKALR